MKNIKKTTSAVLAATILAGGAVTVMQPEIAIAQETDNQKSKLLESGILNSFKDYTVQVGEHTIHYEMRKGQENPERTFILSHGATATTDTMKQVAANLAKENPNSRIILVDLPYHGESTGPVADNVTVHDYTDVMYDFLEQKQADGTISGQVNWTGWSMGGSIGLLLDLKGADIDELTLVNSGPVWHTITGLQAMVPELFDPATVKDVFYGVYVGDFATGISEQDRDDLLSHYDDLTSSPEVMVQDYLGITPDKYNVLDQLDEIQAKTLILSGTEDAVAEIALQHEMDEKIANSSLKLYEDNHSMLMKPEQAKNIAKDMTAYFSK